MIALAALAARHLPFPAPALLVDAAPFAGALEGNTCCISIRRIFVPNHQGCVCG